MYNSDIILQPELLKIQPNAWDKSTLEILSNNKITLKISISDSHPLGQDKPIVVFLHGNSSSQKIFTEHALHISKKYRTLTLDLLGHGDSSKISTLALAAEDKNKLYEAFYNPITMIAIVTQVLESCCVTQAHLVGWSLGGHIAYGVAQLNSQLVASVVTIGSPPIKFDSDGLNKGFHPWFVKELVPTWVNYPKVYDLEEGRSVAIQMGFQDKKDIQIFAEDIVRTDPQMRRHLFLPTPSYTNHKYDKSCIDAEHWVQQTEIPILLIVGEKDAGIQTLSLTGMCNKFKNRHSQVRIIKNAPHALFKTHHQLYFELLSNFLSGVTSQFSTKSVEN